VEKSYFFQDDFLEVLNKHYVEARLHTDKETTPEAQLLRIGEKQRELVGNRGMPTFVVVDPETGKRISKKPQSFSPDSDVILEFLKKNVQS
jgi:hypothetical protein